MDSALAASRVALPRLGAHGRSIALAAGVLLVTIFTRYGALGDAQFHIDDQFYLLTGTAMLDGALPYVDIWDRKPIGLFLIYAGIAALGADSVGNYQIVAGLFAFATSLVIVSTARRLTNEQGAWAAGILYLVMLPMLDGQGGQSPIFYNLFMALAARFTLDAVQRAPTSSRALATMALCGVALLIKPTSLFEGVGFGLTHLWALYRSERRLGVIVPRAALMIGVALAPTAAAFGAYALIGEARTMWDATVMSIFRKGALGADRLRDVAKLVGALLVPTLIAVVALGQQVRSASDRAPIAFLSFWLGFAAIGFVSVPYFFAHYALPLAVPISIAAAFAFSDRRDGLTLLGVAALLPILLLPHQQSATRLGNDELARMARDVSHVGRGGCLYIHNGPPHLYTASRACRATRFVFPDHLESEVESGALPVVPETEVEAIFARRPTTVVTTPREVYERNNRVAALIERYLSCRYAPHDIYQLRPKQRATLWVLRADAPAVCPLVHPALDIIQKRIAD